MLGNRFFDPDAPFTVRLASILIIPAAVWAFAGGIYEYFAGTDPQIGWFKGIASPTLHFVVVVIWARGMAKMQGIFYWWLVIPLYLSLLMVVIGMFINGPGVLIESVLEAEVLEIAHGSLWIVCAALLMSKQSLVAFWRHGRLEERQKSDKQERAKSSNWRLALFLLLVLAVLVVIGVDFLQLISDLASS
jgi:hypothetical protein